MSIKYFFHPQKRKSSEASELSIDQESSSSSSQTAEYPQEPQRKKQHLTAGEKRKLYKANLTFIKGLGKGVSLGHLYESSPADGLFCAICQRWGKPPAGTRGAWTMKGVVDWNHATELLKQHADSKWHRDAAAYAAMAKQANGGNTVLYLQCSSAALEAQERRQKNAAYSPSSL